MQNMGQEGISMEFLKIANIFKIYKRKNLLYDGKNVI